MARRINWKDLAIGIGSACALVGAALAILVLARPGRLHGDTIIVYATTDAARGLISGSEVWLDGQKVGLVKDVTFRPPTVDPRQRLVLTMQVLKDQLQHLRLDSKVDIRSGTSVIGDQVVFLSGGSARKRSAVAGDTIHGGTQSDVEEITSDMALAAKELPGILENVKLLVAGMKTAEGTLGAFGLDGAPQLTRVHEKSARLMAKMSGSNGTLGRVMNGSGALQLRAKQAMAEVDSIRALVTSDKHALGRFRRDSTLMREVGRVRTELAEVARLADSPVGTIGRIRTDSAIVRNIHRDIAALDSLFADAKKHPTRYIVF